VIDRPDDAGNNVRMLLLLPFLPLMMLFGALTAIVFGVLELVRRAFER
jgi:hypothetical protein